MARHASYIPHGVIPAVLLPFDNDFAIDEAAFRKHLRDVAATPGIVRQRRGPTGARSISAACRKNPTAERGLACQCRTVSATGSCASSPFSGSRMIPDRKLDAAALGLPFVPLTLVKISPFIG